VGHHVTVRPVRRELRDEALRCRRVSGIGFAWRCTCGERGPIVSDYREARAGGQAHRAATATPPA
jgi:hypothetical protein